MSMQIGPMPLGPQQDYSHEKMFLKQQEIGARTAAAASSLFGARNSTEHKSQDIKNTTQDMERISLAFNRRLKFIVDQESREVIVKVIDSETDKVIKVLPPEELQRLHQRIRETMGFLFDQMV